jgi:hypothetical protein
MTVTLNIAKKREPREHLLFGEHLTEAKFDGQIRDTFLGQAHIAGTGPSGRTCRECRYWHAWKNKNNSPFSENPPTPVPPGYFSKSHDENPNGLKKARCNRPVLNKAKKAIPHFAKSCRLFEENPEPPPIVRPKNG